MMNLKTGSIRRALLAFVAASLAACTCSGDVVVSEVVGMQRRPKCNLVDIYYDIDGAGNDDTFDVGIRLYDETKELDATSFSGDVGHGIKPGRKRHIVWDAGKDWKQKKGKIRAVITVEPDESQDAVRLWKDGPRWAKMNVGAARPQDHGLYFQWGYTKGWGELQPCPAPVPWWRERYRVDVTGPLMGDDGQLYYLRSPSYVTKQYYYLPEETVHNPKLETEAMRRTIPELVKMDFITPFGNLALSHDAAFCCMGPEWRMPTAAEMYKLIYDCDWKLTYMFGVGGYLVSGRGVYAANSIFIPFSGTGRYNKYYSNEALQFECVLEKYYDYKEQNSAAYLWTSTPSTGNLWVGQSGAHALRASPEADEIGNSKFDTICARSLPMPIRAVKRY